MFNKKYPLCFMWIFLACLYFFSGSIASAHMVEEDGGVHGILHIDPGESPIVGKDTWLHIDFTGSKEKIDLTKCNCTLSVMKGTTTLLSASTTDSTLFTVAQEGMSFTNIFKDKGVFSIALQGITEAKRPFLLTFEVEVVRAANGQSMPYEMGTMTHILVHHSIHIFIFGAAFIFGIIVTLRRLHKSRDTTSGAQ